MSYSSEVLADSPVAYYRMDQASGSVIDASGNGLDGTVNDATLSFQQTGAILTDPSSYSVGFDGSGAQFGVPDDPLLDLGDGPLSLEAWVKRDVTGVSHSIIAKQSNAYRFYITDSGFGADADKVAFEKFGVTPIVLSSVTITDTNWHHVVVTYNGGSTGKMYVDGSDVTQSYATATLADNTNMLSIGSGGGFDYWDGNLDEVALYDSALSATRVLAHYQAGVGQFLKPDADTAAGGWAAFGTASLWEATSDSSDSTYMLGTAS